MDYELSEDQAAFRDVARQFSDRQLLPMRRIGMQIKPFPKTLSKRPGTWLCGLYCRNQPVDWIIAAGLEHHP